MDATKRFAGMKDKPETPKVGVGVVLRRRGGPDGRTQILLGLRKGSHGAGEWSLPGGHMELGEDFLETCKREVLEETGIEIREVGKLGFSNDVFEADGLHYVTLFFEAEWDCDQTPKVMEPDKTEEWRWFSVHDLPDNLFKPLDSLLGEEGIGALAGWRR